MKSVYKIPQKIKCLTDERKRKSIPLFNIVMPVHIISQEDSFVCYYPEKISFPITGHESALFIEDKKIYFESWVEEGWNDKNDCATDNYDLYYKVIVKDFSGNTLSEEVGDLYQAADGTWWIA